MGFSQWLQSEMEKNHITKYRLSKLSGVHQTTISNLLAGANPQIETEKKIRVALSELDNLKNGGAQKEKADSPKGTGQSEIDIIFSQLTPSRQAKLIELARLYLDDQRRSEET